MIKYDFPQYIKSIVEATAATFRTKPIVILKPRNVEANCYPRGIGNYELTTKPKPAKWSGRGYKKKRRK